MPSLDQDDGAEQEQRIRDLEAMVAHLEGALAHFLQDRDAATETAKRNHADLSHFGAGAIVRGLPGGVRKTAAFRLTRLWNSAGIRRLNTRIGRRSTGLILQGKWRLRAPLPVARFETRPAVVADNLYLISGFRPPCERIEPSAWRYDPAADAWAELAHMPLPVTHAGIGVVGTDVWVVGGFVGNNPGPATTRVQIYETLNDHWRDGPPLPVHSASAAAAMLGSRLHVIGGLDLDRKTDVLDHLVLDTADPHAQWSRLAPLPAPGRNHHSAVGLNGGVYVIGGHTGHDGPLVDLKLAHAYEPQSDSWRPIADLPEERHHCEASTFVWKDRVVLGGGLGRGRVAALPDLVTYDPNQDAWESIGLLPIPLWGTVVQLVGDELIVTTGSTHTNKGASGDTWSYPLGGSSLG